MFTTQNNSGVLMTCGNTILTREELALVPTPPKTSSHVPIPHHEVIQALVQTLGFRHIQVTNEQHSVDRSGNKYYGVLDLVTPNDGEFHGCSFSLGLRNSHDKSMRLAMTCGYRVRVCQNGMFSGDFTPVLRKHTKDFKLTDALEVGVGQMQRNFGPMIQQVDFYKNFTLTDSMAKNLLYEVFVEADLDVPHNISFIQKVHEHYFQPQYDEFRARTIWSLTNAFTSAFKELDPINRFEATAAIAKYLNERFRR
jgi:hypothetical protein